MASLTLKPSATLGGLDEKIGANRVVERPDLALVSVAVALGHDAALAKVLSDHLGLELPEPSQSKTSGDRRIVSMTPDQLMIFSSGDGTTVEREIKAAVTGSGYTTNQTDAWVCLEISGPDTIAALERICPVDLSSDVFPNGASARTTMEHLGALIIRLDEDRFLLCSASSSARSFAEAVLQSYHNV